MINQKYLESRIKFLNTFIEPKDKSYKFRLSSYRPGYKRLYQLAIEHKDDYEELFSMPDNSHIENKDFFWYIEGMIDLSDRIERGQIKLKKGEQNEEA